MFLQIVFGLLGAACFSLAGLLLYTAVASRLALWRFQKFSRGIPMPDALSWFGNGTLNWGVRKNHNLFIHQRRKWLKHKTLGSLYGTRPMVYTVDLDLIKQIQAEPETHMNRMPTLNLPFHEVENSIFLAQSTRWKRIRRSFAPAFKNNKFKTPNVVNEIEGSVEKLLKMIDAMLENHSKLDPNGARKVQIDDLARRYSLDLHFSCLYKQAEVINFDERPCSWTDKMAEGVRAIQESPIIHACMVFPILAPIVEMFIWYFHPQGFWRRGILDFIKRQTKLGLEARKEVNEAKETGREINPDNFTLKDGTQFKRNMIDYVIDQFLDGKLSRDEFFSTSFFLLQAAVGTSADSIIHTLYHLAANPEIQEKLRKSVQLEGVNSEYLGWVLNESLRLLPPVSSGPARCLGADLEIEGGKYRLPKGTFVLMPLYMIHRLPEYWGDDAEEFKPERFRDTRHWHPLQYMPFGALPRTCPGKDFAMFEMRRLFAALITRYKLEAIPKPDLEEFDSPFFFVILPNSPHYMVIKKLDESDESGKKRMRLLSANGKTKASNASAATS